MDYSLALDIYKVDSAYFATLFVDKTEIKIIDDTRKNLPVTATIPMGSNNEIVNAALIVGPTGGGPSVYIRSARVFALNAVEQTELNQPLETPQNMRLGDNGYSVTWNAIKKMRGLLRACKEICGTNGCHFGRRHGKLFCRSKLACGTIHH